MKVILLVHIKGLGKKGEIRDVSEGYFRNQLAPKKLAAVATIGTVNQVQAYESKTVEKLGQILGSARAVEEKLKGFELRLVEKASETGKLYASVNAKEIMMALQRLARVDIPERLIESPTIKNVGTYTVKIKLHKDVIVSLPVHVDADIG